jgi:RimJ/RimL family protein N-acetyltransferase
MGVKFDLQPELRGKLLHLRPLKADDFEALYKCASDPLIWEVHPQPTRYQRPVFQEYFNGAMKSGGALAALDANTHEIIGSSRFYNFDSNKSSIVIGYTFLARKYWGGEYNREMKFAMLNHAFKFVDTAIFQVGENNLRSRRAMEKIGGQLVRAAVLDGINHVIFEIKKEKFVAVKD